MIGSTVEGKRMRRAGGIIGLVAGIFAVLAAVMTLGFGGLASWAKNDHARELLYFGWAGLAFSFLTIVLGAIAMSATSRWPGVLLILCALVGALAGGTFVAIFMALALVGGVLAALPGRRRLALDGAELVR